MGIKTETFKIENELGLHARAAAVFVKVANRYVSEVFIRKESLRVNGKSIMGVLMLAAAKNSEIIVEADGPDAEDVIIELGKLVKDKFGEEK